MSIIAADVGGTKTRLVYVAQDAPDDILFEASLVSGDFASFAELLTGFIAQIKFVKEGLSRLSLALPGVVEGDIAKLTNLPWVINKSELEARFGVSQIEFMNDFQAAAYGIARLAETDLIQLNSAVHRQGATRVVLGAGTGLGMAWLQYEHGVARAIASEGGHVDFAPVSQQQIELLKFLQDRYRDVSAGHVSYERLLSGAGLVALYEFCARTTAGEIDAAWVDAEAKKGNKDAQAAMRLFAQVYGSYVGNIALLFNPGGGIYIAGGIAGKIPQWMQSRDFIEAYLHKGRMQALVKSFPVYIVTNERVGVMGALAYAVSKQQVE